MAESPFRERRYRIEEVRAVVKHALSHEPEPAATGRALTAGELGQLLTDLGVSAETAARSLDEASTSTSDASDPDRSWLGGPKRIVFEGEVHGELADDRREDVVEIIREEMGDTGRVETLGRTLTWTTTPIANGQQRKLSVKVRVRDGRTRIRIEEDMTPVRAGAWLGFGLGGGLGLGVLGVAIGKATHSPALAVLSWLLILAASLFAAHAVTGAVSRRRKAQLGRVFDKVRREVELGTATRARVASFAPADDDRARDEAAEDEAADEVASRRIAR